MTIDSVEASRRRASLVLILTALAALATGWAAAQADDIVFEVEILRVDLVRGDDGEIAERFVPVQEAIPGEIIEYRVTATNEGDIIYRPGTVVVTLPLGEGVTYLEDSATPSSERVVTEFSADGGTTFSEPPVLIETTEDEEGDDEPQERAADPSEYDAIRWTFSVPFEPGQGEELVYRVEVR